MRGAYYGGSPGGVARKAFDNHGHIGALEHGVPAGTGEAAHSGLFPRSSRPHAVRRHADEDSWGSVTAYWRSNVTTPSDDSRRPPPAAWYRDRSDPRLLRYWDGAHWTEHTHPASNRAPDAPDVPASGHLSPERPARGGQSAVAGSANRPSPDLGPGTTGESPEGEPDQLSTVGPIGVDKSTPEVGIADEPHQLSALREDEVSTSDEYESMSSEVAMGQPTELTPVEVIRAALDPFKNRKWDKRLVEATNILSQTPLAMAGLTDVFWVRKAPSTIRGAGVFGIGPAGIGMVEVGPKENYQFEYNWSQIAAVRIGLHLTSACIEIVSVDGESQRCIGRTTEIAKAIAERSPSAIPTVAPGESWWHAQVFPWPRALTLSYLGGMGGSEAPGLLTFGVDGLGFTPRLQPKGMLLPWEVIDGITAEGPMEAQKRVTATRMLAVGLYAFAWKKNEAASYLTVSTTSGDQVMFETALHLAKLQEHLRPIAGHVGAVKEQSAVPAAPPREMAAPALDVTEQLERLGTLHEKGLLTVEEFQTTKSELLGRI